MMEQDVNPGLDLEGLQERLGYRFRTPEHLIRALTHSSWRHEARVRLEEDPLDNEPLEFLGDALIGFIIARELLQRHPDAGEGFLTRARSHLVSTASLSEIGRELRLGPCLRLGRGEESSGGSEKASILENTLEALIAAILLDGGYRRAAQVVRKLFRPRLQAIHEGQLFAADAKSRLQELLQSRGLAPPTYTVRLESGLDHQKRFLVAVTAGSATLAEAEGRNKKKAQRLAAARALERLVPDGTADEEALRSLVGRTSPDPEKVGEEDE